MYKLDMDKSYREGRASFQFERFRFPTILDSDSFKKHS